MTYKLWLQSIKGTREAYQMLKYFLDVLRAPNKQIRIPQYCLLLKWVPRIVKHNSKHIQDLPVWALSLSDS